MTFDLRETLDGLQERPFVTGYKPRTSNYPSAASVQYEKDGETVTEGTCQRQNWYDWKGFGKTMSVGARSARIQRILKAGKFYEEMIVQELKDAGIYVADEVPFFIPELKLSGRVDAFIKDPSKKSFPSQRPSIDEVIGVEIKTVAGYYGCQGPITSTRNTALSPKVDNVLQCMCYLKYFMPHGIKKWLLLYVDRGLGQSEAQPTHWNYHTITINEAGNPVIQNDAGTVVWEHFTMDDVMDRFALMLKQLKEDTLPDRDYAIQYSNAKIAQLYAAGTLSKTDTAAVDRYVRNNGKPIYEVTEDDPAILTKGDWRCRFCDYAEACYSDNPKEIPGIKVVAQPKAPKPINEPTEVEDIV